MRENVARLRQLLSEAVVEPSKPAALTDLVLDQSPKARAEREIVRIATWYKWEAEVIRFLDAENVLTLGSLGEERLLRLLDRLRRLEACYQDCLDPPDGASAS